MSLLTDSAFDLLRARTRLKPDSKATNAARAVMVNGMQYKQAESVFDVSNAAIYTAIRRIKKEMTKLNLCPCCGKPTDDGLGQFKNTYVG